MTEDCENLAKCQFFKYSESSNSKRLALKGFVNMYCRGSRQDTCTRKRVCAIMGAPEHVPDNMMPNGMAISGTSNAKWSGDVVGALKQLGVRVYQFKSY